MNSGNIESLISTQYLGLLQKTATGTSSNVSSINGNGNILTFSQVLSEASGKVNNVNDMFQSVFPNNSVQTKSGNCNVTKEAWNRNDFPVWQYFQKNSSSECLNNWKGVGVEPPQGNQGIQKGLKQIGFGEIVIMIPENLQKKMESDPEYAEEVLKKVQKWKTDYDSEDNAIVASLGHNATLYQMTKSYCIQLDEEGNVEKHVVISGGMNTGQSEEKGEVKEEIVPYKKISKKEKSGSVPKTVVGMPVAEREYIDYEKISAYMTGYWNKENKR